ncbi:unnamed protein product, partial [Mesorhabditis spiculigera]
MQRYGLLLLLAAATATAMANKIVEIDCEVLSVCGQDLHCVEQLAERLQLDDCLVAADKRAIYSFKRGQTRSLIRILKQMPRL